LSLALLSLSAACGGEPPETPHVAPPLVVASIFPIGDVVRNLAGDAVRVEVLLPPGALPATWEVTPRQLRDVQATRIFFLVGGGLDEWVADVLEATEGDPEAIRLTHGISLLAADHDHGHGTGNPHVWLDPILVRDHIVPQISRALIGLAPEAEDALLLRAKAYSDSLSALDEEIREALAPLEGRSFVATHSAWTYFAARYGLEEAGVIHPKPGHEPGSREIAELMELAADREIRCVFTEPQVGEAAARALINELDIPSCTLDPLGDPDLQGRDSYLALLRFNTAMFRQGMGARGS
jgi:zinc transport system substrate-binding protein